MSEKKGKNRLEGRKGCRSAAGARISRAILAATILLAWRRISFGQCSGCANASFRPAGHVVELPTQPYSLLSSLVTADLNGDGIPDLAIVDGHQAVHILLGTGSGGFRLSASRDLPGNPMAILAADMDGDGIMDLVVARYGSDVTPDPGGVTVLLGDGAGGIRSQIDSAAGSSPYSIAAADFDGDGKMDVAVVGTGTSALILLGNGAGGFGTQITFPVPPSSLSTVDIHHRVFAADLNGDGIQDLGIARADGYLEMLFGTGGGSFSPPRYIAVAVGDVITGDLKGDGVHDVVVGRHILLGLGGDQFAAPADLPGEVAGPNAVGDFNQDGAPDLIVQIAPEAGQLTVALGDGLGGFSLGSSVPGSTSPYDGPVVTADFDGDGKHDLAFLRFADIAIARGVGGGLFESPPLFPAQEFVQGGLGADFNGDGAADVAVVEGQDLVEVRLSNRDGTLGPAQQISLPTGVHALAAGDFNEDGHVDLVVASTGTPSQVLLFMGDGAGHFGPPVSFGAGVLPDAGQPTAVDLNGDGHLDVLLPSGGQFMVLLGDGHGHLGPPQQVYVTTAFKYVVVDMNHDGKPDLVGIYGTQIQIYFGNGAGGFVAGPIATSSVAQMESLAVADFEGTGELDVVVNDLYSTTVQVFRGGGSGAFQPPLTFQAITAGDLFSGDFIGNGRSQLAIAGGTFAVEALDSVAGLVPLGVFVAPGFGLAVADFTGDGKPDYLGATFTGEPVVYLLVNTTCEPRRLAVVQNVSSCDVPGSAFAVQPIVRVEDDGGNPLTCSTEAISATIAPGTGTPGAFLGGTTTVPAAGGLATFTDLSIDLAGRGYRLLFSAPGSDISGTRPFSQGLAPPTITSDFQACTGSPERFEAPSGYDSYLWKLDGSAVGRLPVLTLPGLAAGSHAVGLTVTQDACTASSSISVTPQASPQAPLASNNGPVPSGGTIQLTASTVAGATYQWNGPRGFTSTLQNPTVPNASPAVAGIYSVVATVGACSSPAASTSVTVVPPPWCVGCANASFASVARAFGTDSPPRGIAVGDFDGDGALDVVVTSAGGLGLVSFFAGDGRGGFGPGIDSPTATFPDRVLAADLNGDGLADLIVVAGGQVWVMLATGSGHFGTAQLIPGIQDPVIGDFNEDGLPDLAGGSTTSNGIAVLLGNGLGGFGPPSVYPTSGAPFRPAQVADLNGDGHQDIVAGSSNGVLIVLMGNGLGGFSPGPGLGQSVYPNARALGDVDGDGVPDLVIGSNGVTGTLSLFRGSGDGSFSFMRDVTVPLVAHPIRIADVNADGKNDIVFPGLEVLISKGGFDFEPVISILEGGGFDFVLGDIDRDGRLDAVSAGQNSFNVLRGGGSAGFQTPPLLTVASRGGPVVADLNHDGHPDIALPSTNGAFQTAIVMLLNDGTGVLGPPISISAGGIPGASQGAGLAIGDFNEDGSPDFAVLATFPGGVSVVLSDGYGGYVPPVAYQVGEGFLGVNGIVVADFNGDGHKDLAVAGQSSVTILLGDGHGGFQIGNSISTSAYLSSIAAADFNHDGRDDLVVATNMPGSVSLYLANPDGSMGAPLSVPVPASSAAALGVVLGDFNNDGNMDIAAAGDQLAIVLGDGAGGLGAPALFGNNASASRIVAGDFNGDGKLDLALMRDRIVLFIGDGAGGFAQSRELAIGAMFGGAAVADLDGDGRPDLAVFEDVGNLAVLSNTNCLSRRLGATTNSTCAPPGSPLAPEPVVKVFDDGSNVVACDSGPVNASIAAGTGTAGAVLSGKTGVSAVGGVAAFTDLAIDRSGTGYQLEFHHPSASPARTAPFSVGSAPSPPATGNNGPVCAGSALQLTASTISGATYRWTGPNGFVSAVQNPVIQAATVAAAGLYTVTVTINGCGSASASTTAVVNPAPSASITAPSAVCPNSTGNSASVPDAGPGATYAWSIQNGTITSGQGTASIVFTAGRGAPVILAVTVTDSKGCSGSGSATVAMAACPMSFWTVAPCRLVDTRGPSGLYGGPALAAHGDRVFVLAGACGTSPTAVAISVNLTVTRASNAGDLRVYANGSARPPTSVINFGPGQTRANNAILMLGPGGDVVVHTDQASGSVDLILDVNGFFH